MNIEEIEAKIRAAIVAEMATGVRLRSGSFGSKRCNCMCPISCVTSQAGIDGTGDVNAAADHLGVDVNWIWSFIDGFDRLNIKGVSKEAYELGRKLRDEFLP